MIFFTADTHFCHINAIKFCNRPFQNIEQMNKTLIENWNSRVAGGDDIYILGDFLFRGTGVEANEIVKKLNGKKYLIRGNHDRFLDNKDFDKSGFVWIKDYHVLYYEKRKFVLFHYPIFEWDGYYRNSIHLYGHVHSGEMSQKVAGALGGTAVNVGTDVHNYYPVSIEEILKIASIGVSKEFVE
jgi:calcineurin-like phosphoesterase family protein